MDYPKLLNDFVLRLTTDLKRGQQERGEAEDVFVLVDTGRKFDKVSVRTGSNTSVRYFVRKSDGTIFGAKSKLAPNLKWYFGDLTRFERWDWSDFHGRPVNDAEIRAVGSYAGYIRYIKTT